MISMFLGEYTCPYSRSLHYLVFDITYIMWIFYNHFLMTLVSKFFSPNIYRDMQTFLKIIFVVKSITSNVFAPSFDYLLKIFFNYYHKKNHCPMLKLPFQINRANSQLCIIFTSGQSGVYS